MLVNIHTHRPTGHAIELRTSGIHPWEAGVRDAASLLPLPAEVQAIGETGLDALRGPDLGIQLACFRAQLALARDTGLPVVIHCVRTFGEVMRELERYELRAVIFHGFIGSGQQAAQAAARGYCLSFGERTFASARTLGALRSLPPEHLFLETDDSPAGIAEIYDRAAAALGIGRGELERIVFDNYERIFGSGGTSPGCPERTHTNL